MSECWPIDQIARFNRVVYYPEVGYVLYPTPPRQGLAAQSWLDYALDYHIKRLKLLSLYFDKILIPFSHVFGVVDELHCQLLCQLLDHTDMRLFIERFILFVGGWGGRSSDDVAAHQIDFLRGVGWSVDRSIVVARHPALRDMNISSRSIEEQKDVLWEGVARYRDLISDSYGVQAGPLTDAIRASGYGDIPFVHQTFWQRLQSLRLPRNLKESASREVNRIYFNAGEIGMPGVTAYAPLHAEPQQGLRKSLKSGIPSILYSPDVFLALLRCYFSKKQVTLIACAAGSQLLTVRTPEWCEFVDDYHALLSEIVHVTENYSLPNITNPEVFSHILRESLLQDTRLDCSAFVEFVAKALAIVIKSGGGPGDMPLAEASKVVQKPLLDWLESKIIWSRHPAFVRWFRILSKQLEI
ncbi:MAG: hypothetical protein ACYC64_07995 [Armatimonadota bacterium]